MKEEKEKGCSTDPVRLMLPSPGLEPALFSAVKELVGEPDFGTGRSFEGFTEKAEFFDEDMVSGLDHEPGLADFNDSMGFLFPGMLRRRITFLAMRIQPDIPVLGSSAIPLIHHLLDARHTL